MSELSSYQIYPEGFLWGAATAAHQIEGGNNNNDWTTWEANNAAKLAEAANPQLNYGGGKENYRHGKLSLAKLKTPPTTYPVLEPAVGSIGRKMSISPSLLA